MRILPIACDANAFSLACVAAGETILIDAGFSPQQWQRAESLHDVRAHQVNHLLITHEHGDHLKGLSWWLQEMALKNIRIWGGSRDPTLPETACSPELSVHPHSRRRHFFIRRFSCPGHSCDPRCRRTSGLPNAPWGFHWAHRHGLRQGDSAHEEALGKSDQAFLSPYYADAMLPDPDRSDDARRVVSLHGHPSKQALADWLRESGGRLERLLLGHRHPQWSKRAKIMSDLLPVLREKVVVELRG
jgi:ribonuclease BN (tRNA processing enzyme)